MVSCPAVNVTFAGWAGWLSREGGAIEAGGEAAGFAFWLLDVSEDWGPGCPTAAVFDWAWGRESVWLYGGRNCANPILDTASDARVKKVHSAEWR